MSDPRLQQRRKKLSDPRLQQRRKKLSDPRLQQRRKKLSDPRLQQRRKKVALATFFLPEKNNMLQIFYISDDYIKHLKKVESKVANNYNEEKPYVGILHQDQSLNWFAPLTSEKEKFDGRGENYVWIFKLHEVGKPENKLGLIDFRNMIPVPKECANLYPFTRLDSRYKLMMEHQYAHIKIESERIKTKSLQYYNLIVGKKTANLNQHACDFTLLAGQSLKYTIPVKIEDPK